MLHRKYPDSDAEVEGAFQDTGCVMAANPVPTVLTSPATATRKTVMAGSNVRTKGDAQMSATE